MMNDFRFETHADDDVGMAEGPERMADGSRRIGVERVGIEKGVGPLSK
jgi:hypothetical protein